MQGVQRVEDHRIQVGWDFSSLRFVQRHRYRAGTAYSLQDHLGELAPLMRTDVLRR